MLIFLHPVLAASHRLRVPITREEMRPVVQYVVQNWQDGDALYMYYLAMPAFEYYSQKLGFGEEYIQGVSSREDWTAYTADLDQLRGKQRVWIVFSHVWTWAGVDEQKFFLYHLDTIGQRSQSFEASGAAVYLYDLTG